MNTTDFDKRFKETRERIERSHRRWPIWFAISVVVQLGILGFIGWVVVKVMQHFGVI